jgi:hypothetical protein
MDAASPFRHGKAPYVQFKNIKMRRNFWSGGEPVQLASIQTQINKRKAQIDFIADLMGNPVWVADVGSGIKRGQITNRPGIIIWKRDGSDVHMENAPSIPDYLFKTIYDLKDEAEFITGVKNILVGDKPGSVSAGSAIQELLERALVRVREKVKYMEASLQDVGKICMSLIRQYWTEERQFILTGAGLNGEQTVEFTGSYLLEDPDIMMIAGSSMPISKSSKFEQGIIMVDKGLFDREEFFKYIEYPNADVVIQRLMQVEQQAQQAQEQMQQQDMQLRTAVS